MHGIVVIEREPMSADECGFATGELARIDPDCCVLVSPTAVDIEAQVK